MRGQHPAHFWKWFEGRTEIYSTDFFNRRLKNLFRFSTRSKTKEQIVSLGLPVPLHFCIFLHHIYLIYALDYIVMLKCSINYKYLVHSSSSSLTFAGVACTVFSLLSSVLWGVAFPFSFSGVLWSSSSFSDCDSTRCDLVRSRTFLRSILVSPGTTPKSSSSSFSTSLIGRLTLGERFRTSSSVWNEKSCYCLNLWLGDDKEKM